MPRTFYDVLAVSEDASQEEIDAAYRERVKETHPDLNDAPDAADRFQEVKRAEEVLGDPDERSRYDRLGHDAYVRETTGANVGADGDAAGVDVGGDAGADGGWGGGWESVHDAAAEATSGGAEAGHGATSDGSVASEEPFAEGADGGGTAADGRNGDTVGTAPGDGYAVHDWTDEVEVTRRRDPLTQEKILLGVVVFVLYPVFVYSSVTPVFSILTNVVVGCCTLLVVAYLVTRPRIGVVVFGAWSVLTPIAIPTVLGWPAFSPLTLLALTVSWVPFGYAVVVARVTRR